MNRIAAVELTKDTRANRHYECCREYGGCGQTFTDVKAAHAVHYTMCPNCHADGCEEVFDHKLGRKVYRIQVIHPDGPPRFTPDISGQDGRTNEDVDMSVALGEGVHISSRSKMEDALKRARENSYETSRGDKSRMLPHRKDPNDPMSPIVWEKETVEHEGFDPGELHPVEQLKSEANEPKSAFTPGRTLAEEDKILEAKVGHEMEGFENVTMDEVAKVSDAMYERAKEL